MSLIRTRLEYVHPWPNQAGLLLARSSGLFAKAGLDVEIFAGGGERGDAAAIVERGEADFGVVPTNRLLAYREAGYKLLGVAAFNQEPIEALVSTKSRGVGRLADLAGKRVGFAPSPRISKLLEEAVVRDGGDWSKVKVVDTGAWEPDIRAVELGDFDAIVNVKAWEPFLGRSGPDERVTIPLADNGGVRFHAYYLTVRESTAKRNPELVRAYVVAATAGYERALADPEAALDALQVAVANQPRRILRESYDVISKTWKGKNGKWGSIDLELQANYAKWLAGHGFIKGTTDPKAAVTTEFLPS
jgi:ABC-type nitrate/sulfonate/bicarbonate transport system substrate-binding protein